MLSYIQRIQIIRYIGRINHIKPCTDIVYEMYGAIFLMIISMYMPIIPLIHDMSNNTDIFMITMVLAYWAIVITILNIQKTWVIIVVPFLSIDMFVSLLPFQSGMSYHEAMGMIAIAWFMNVSTSLCYGVIYYGYAGTIIREHGPTLSHHQRMIIMRRYPTFAQYVHPPIPSCP